MGEKNLLSVEKLIKYEYTLFVFQEKRKSMNVKIKIINRKYHDVIKNETT